MTTSRGSILSNGIWAVIGGSDARTDVPDPFHD
jgi:hypothetical protein